MDQPDTEHLLTINEIAKVLRTSTQTVRRWLDHGIMGGFHLPGGWRVSQVDLDKFLQERHNKRMAPAKVNTESDSK